MSHRMTDREVMQTVTHRLALWGEELERRRATPFVMLAIGVDSGRELVFAPDNLSESDVRQILADTLIALRQKQLGVTR